MSHNSTYHFDRVHVGDPSNRQLERHIRARAVDTGNIVWTAHSEKRMRTRRINRAMVLDVLRQGTFTRPPEPEIRGTGLRCCMGRFVAGVQVEVVVYVEYPAPELVVVTVIDVNGN